MAQFFYPTIEQLVRARVRPDGRQGIARFLAETREAVPRGIVEGQQAYTAEHVTTPRAFREQLIRQGYVPYRVAEDGTEQLLDTEQFRRWYMDGGDEPLKRIEQMVAPRPRDQEIVATFYERGQEPYYMYTDPTTGEQKRATTLPTIQGYRWRVVQADQDGGARGGAAAPKEEGILAVRKQVYREMTTPIPEEISPSKNPERYLAYEKAVLTTAQTARVRPDERQKQAERVSNLDAIATAAKTWYGKTDKEQRASRAAYESPEKLAERLATAIKEEREKWLNAKGIKDTRRALLTQEERDFLHSYVRMLWNERR